MYYIINIQSPVYYRKFRHILVYLRSIQTLSHPVAYLEPCLTLGYSEPCHIQNPGIFRAQDIFRTLSRYILAYLECCLTLAYWEPCYIQDFVIFKIWAYLGPQAYSEFSFRDIQAYSDIFNSSNNNINFLFYRAYFLTKFKKAYVFWLQWLQFQYLTESTEIIRNL